MPPLPATIYTDGSCHTQSLNGAWVAILFIGNERKQLSGLEINTTHNRMELTAVIKAIEFLRDHYTEIADVTIYTDSQYVTALKDRQKRLTALSFASKRGRVLQNSDLIKKLLELFESYTIETIKVKAHQKINDLNKYNIEADRLSRKIVREAVKK
jgi:ribonuclease HI